MKLFEKILLWWHKLKYSESAMDGICYGKFRVIYNQGGTSVPMYYRAAKDYADMFGGKVIWTVNPNIKL